MAQSLHRRTGKAGAGTYLVRLQLAADLCEVATQRHLRAQLLQLTLEHIDARQRCGNLSQGEAGQAMNVGRTGARASSATEAGRLWERAAPWQ